MPVPGDLLLVSFCIAFVISYIMCIASNGSMSQTVSGLFLFCGGGKYGNLFGLLHCFAIYFFCE